jgi:hypothetical protein
MADVEKIEAAVGPNDGLTFRAGALAKGKQCGPAADLGMGHGVADPLAVR